MQPQRCRRNRAWGLIPGVTTQACTWGENPRGLHGTLLEARVSDRA